MAYFPNATFARDGNGVPITVDGFFAYDSQVLTGNNTTVVTPIFTIVGTVLVKGIWGTVTTVLGANHTASAFRFNDATAHSDITLSTGTDISAAPVGSSIVKKGVAGTAITLLKADQERVSEPTTVETLYLSPFTLVGKNGVTTNIEYVYATTDQPTSGAINFGLLWLPLSTNAAVTPL